MIWVCERCGAGGGWGYQPAQLTAGGWNLMRRRSFLQVGYSGLLGLGLPGLLAAREAARASATGGRARSVIVILLSGGLGQHDSFDMKPEAPEGIRGEFKPIETAVPGIRICEHLPRPGGAGRASWRSSARCRIPRGTTWWRSIAC